MASSTFHLTKDVEALEAELSPTTYQEKQLLRERDQDHDKYQDQDQDQDQARPKTDQRREQRQKRIMASPRGILLALLVCCLMTLGLASAKFHQARGSCHDEGRDAQQGVVDGEQSSLSSLLNSSEIRGLLEKFHVPIAKRQASSNTTTAASAVTSATTALSSSTEATVAASSSSVEQASSSASSSIVQETPSSTPASTAVSTVVSTSISIQATTTTATAQATNPTPSETSAASSASSAGGGTTLSTQSTQSTQSTLAPGETSSKTTGSPKSSSLSSTLVTATLTSTLPDGGISVVTRTSYSYVGAQDTGSVTTPEASLQTGGAAPEKLLTHGMAAAGAGFWLLQQLY